MPDLDKEIEAAQSQRDRAGFGELEEEDGVYT